MHPKMLVFDQKERWVINNIFRSDARIELRPLKEHYAKKSIHYHKLIDRSFIMLVEPYADRLNLDPQGIYTESFNEGKLVRLKHNDVKSQDKTIEYLGKDAFRTIIQNAHEFLVLLDFPEYENSKLRDHTFNASNKWAGMKEMLEHIKEKDDDFDKMCYLFLGKTAENPEKR